MTPKSRLPAVRWLSDTDPGLAATDSALLAGKVSDPSPALDGDDPGALAAGFEAWRGIGTDHLIVALDPCTPETVARFTGAVAAWRT